MFFVHVYVLGQTTTRLDSIKSVQINIETALWSGGCLRLSELPVYSYFYILHTIDQ